MSLTMLQLFQLILIPHKFKFCYSSRFVLQLLHSFSSNLTSHNFPNLSTALRGSTTRPHLLQIHAQVIQTGAQQDNLIATRLIGHYPSHIALRVFHQLQNPNIFPFNAIIRVLAEKGHFYEALFMFKRLKQQPILPNELTFSFLLKACFHSRNALYAQQIHNQIQKMGYLGDSFVCNGLVSVYAKGHHNFMAARKVFDETPDKSLPCCWTSLIAGCAQSGRSEEVLQLFYMMIQQNLSPENDSMVSVLSACSNLEIVEIVKWVAILLEFGSGPKVFCHDSVNTVLVYLYGKWGKIEKARERFDQISDNGKRSLFPWNAMVGAYVQNGIPMEGLSLFRMMMAHLNTRPNHVTMVSVLSACAQIGDLDLGGWVHEYINCKGPEGIVGSNRILATALIDMYSKCGSLVRAKEVFEHIVCKDVVSFNAMIMGLATNGKGDEALRLFSKMRESGLQPNDGTFIGVLCACSHSGLSEKGRQIFTDMTSSFSISPKLEHYACYIDILARAGLVEEALEVVISMPFKPNNFIWGALLGGCLLHSRVELAREVSRRLVEVEPHNSGGYVMLANAFAADSQWSDVSALRWLMREKGVKKQPGCSWISVNGVVHEFLVGSLVHPEIEGIYYTLNRLVKQMKVTSH